MHLRLFWSHQKFSSQHYDNSEGTAAFRASSNLVATIFSVSVSTEVSNANKMWGADATGMVLWHLAPPLPVTSLQQLHTLRNNHAPVVPLLRRVCRRHWLLHLLLP